MEKNKIYNEDCLVTMRNHIDSRSVNVILTSPPYNTGRSVTNERARSNHEARYDCYADGMSNDEYDQFTVDLYNGFDKVLSENGVVLYNISYGNENPTNMWTCITEVCRRTVFMVADIIVWKKSNALPNNVSSNKLTRICEYVFVMCRKSEYKTFQMNKEESESRSSKGQKMYNNVYNYIEAPNNDGSTILNKATFSSVLVRKLLTMYAKPNQLVYDPFMGTGTTAIGCIRGGYNYIGSEISSGQYEFSLRRIKEEQQQLTLF